MSLMMERTQKVTASAAAQDVEVACRSFLMVNTSENAVVYFKEKEDDGKAVTADTGFALLPGQTTPMPLNAKTLSIMATEEADVRLLYLRGVC